MDHLHPLGGVRKGELAQGGAVPPHLAGEAGDQDSGEGGNGSGEAAEAVCDANGG